MTATILRPMALCNTARTSQRIAADGIRLTTDFRHSSAGRRDGSRGRANILAGIIATMTAGPRSSIKCTVFGHLPRECRVFNPLNPETVLQRYKRTARQRTVYAV